MRDTALKPPLFRPAACKWSLKIPRISVTKLLHKYIQSFDLIFCAFIKSNFIQKFLITDINKIQIEYRGVAVFILCYVFVQLRGAKLMIFIAPCRPIISSFNYSAAEARSPLSSPFC